MIPEVVDLFALLTGTYGMFQGTDIDHPIYALLFSNLIFPVICTIFNFAILIWKSFDLWLRVSMMTNYLSTLFHLVSWSVISILRFLYLQHQNWLESKFPDVKKLKILSLLTQFGSYLFLLMIDLVCLAIVAVPYGWPKNAFIIYVPFQLQIRTASFFAFIYFLPVLISAIFYVILLANRSKLFHNKVAEQNVEQNSASEIRGPEREHDIFSLNSVSQADFENEQNKRRCKAEKESAMRALTTNFFLNVLTIGGALFWLIPSYSLRNHLIVFQMSVLKGLLPIATTMANFGTIQSVSIKLSNIFFQKNISYVS